jgi:hypothetical protein
MPGLGEIMSLTAFRTCAIGSFIIFSMRAGSGHLARIFGG